MLGFSTNAYCCLDATQERIIPLGTSENCLIGIEIISNRYGVGESNSVPVWNHKIALKGFNKDYSDFLIRELNYKVSVPNEKSDSILTLEITKALQYLNSEYKGQMAKPYKSYFDFYFDDTIVGTDLKISSNRKYENKTHKLLIFHLGTGQEFELASTGKIPIKKEFKFSEKLETIMDAVFIEPVLHHGKGFDYFKLNEK